MTSPRLFKPPIIKQNMTELDFYREIMNIFRNTTQLALIMNVPEIEPSALVRLMRGVYERFKIEYGIEPIIELHR